MSKSTKLLTPDFSDYSALWTHLHHIYIAKRGRSGDSYEEVTPQTTHEDVRQITKCWEDKVWLAFLHHPFGYDGDLIALSKWNHHRDRVYRDVLDADPKSVYPLNEWFWHTVTKDVAKYLNKVNNPAPQTQSQNEVALTTLQAFGTVLGHGLRAYLDGRKAQQNHDNARRSPQGKRSRRSNTNQRGG